VTPVFAVGQNWAARKNVNLLSFGDLVGAKVVCLKNGVGGMIGGPVADQSRKWSPVSKTYPSKLSGVSLGLELGVPIMAPGFVTACPGI